jgi:hypothetical protein
MLVADAVSMTFLVTLIGPTVVFMVTHVWWWIWLVAAILGANVAVIGLKEMIAPAGSWALRPPDAYGCDALCIGGPAGGQPGFPSGHMTTTTMFVVALWLRFQQPVILWVGVPWIFAMAWARWTKQCHNWRQIVGGTLFGGISAYAFQLSS